MRNVRAPCAAELRLEMCVTSVGVPTGYGYGNGGGVIINNNNSEDHLYCVLTDCYSACGCAGIASHQKLQLTLR